MKREMVESRWKMSIIDVIFNYGRVSELLKAPPGTFDTRHPPSISPPHCVYRTVVCAITTFARSSIAFCTFLSEHLSLSESVSANEQKKIQLSLKAKRCLSIAVTGFSCSCRRQVRLLQGYGDHSSALEHSGRCGEVTALLLRKQKNSV